jgi:hypothetical protein
MHADDQIIGDRRDAGMAQRPWLPDAAIVIVVIVIVAVVAMDHSVHRYGAVDPVPALVFASRAVRSLRDVPAVGFPGVKAKSDAG